jgi:hypothetical protein
MDFVQRRPHGRVMTQGTPPTDDDLRVGEAAVALPPQTDAGVYFIGIIRTPWQQRGACPKRGSLDGPICSIVVDERWRTALTDI